MHQKGKAKSSKKEGGQTVRPEVVIVWVIRKSESGPRGSRKQQTGLLAEYGWVLLSHLPLNCIKWLANLVER